MSDEARKIPKKLSFQDYLAKRAAIRAGAEVLSTKSNTGTPTWADDLVGTYGRDAEFTGLADEYVKLYVAGRSSVHRLREILARLHALRKEAATEKLSITHWMGRYIKTLPVTASALSKLEIKNALSHADVFELAPNPWLAQEYQYQTLSVPPDDWVLWTLQSDPHNRDLVEDLLKYCFANPLLVNMLSRLDRGLSQQRPEWQRVSAYWNPALKGVVAESTLVRMSQLPNWRTTDLDLSASPGFPFNVMPLRDGATQAFSTVEDVYARDGGAFFNELATSVVNYALKPRSSPPYDHRLTMYCVQAGNVKHVLRSELAAKPNRCIFSSPLILRHVAGAVSQPFYENWSHPGSLLGSSFSHGGALHICATILRCKASLTAVLEHLEVVPGEIKGMNPSVRRLRARRGLFSAPDKVEYDIGMRPEPMQAFATYTDGVLPLESELAPEQRPGVKAWLRLNKWSHDQDGEHKVVVTNHRLAIRLPVANPSGSMWTTTRNTWIDLAGEEATARAAWHAVHPNREYERFLFISAYGDDTVNYFFQSGPGTERLWTEMIKRSPTIGWSYKEGTTSLTNDFSSLEILGRHIYAWVNGDEVLGLFGARPAEKLLRTLVYPKKATKTKPKDGKPGINPAELRACRLIAALDEAFAYPDSYRVISYLWQRNKGAFPNVRPAWDEYGTFDPLFEVDNTARAEPRSWAESAKLHLGVEVVTVMAAPAAGSSDEDIDVDLDTIPAAARAPKQHLPVVEKREAVEAPEDIDFTV